MQSVQSISLKQLSEKAFTLLISLCISFIFLSGLSLKAQAQALDPAGKSDVIIVGAGLSGLTTAYKLKKAGLTYKILELTPRVGGRARTAKYDDGVIVEAGLAEFWESNPAMEIIKELKLPYHDSLTYSSLMMNGKLYPFTQNTNEDFKKFLLNPAEVKAFDAWNLQMEKYSHQVKAKKLDKFLWSLQDISLADWIAKSKLPKKVSEWIRLSLEVEIGTTWDVISALDGIAEWHIFLGKGEKPVELDNGNETLIETMADNVGRENIGLGMQVMRFKTTKDGVEVDAMDTATFKHYTYKAKYAVSTIPLYRLAELQFEPTLPQDKQDAISTQTWGSYFTAHVFMDPAASKYWNTKAGELVLPILSDGPLGVIYSATTGEKKGPYVINLLVTGPAAEKFNYRAILFEQVRKELNEAFEKQWPGSSKYIQKYQFYRYHPRAIASWPVGRSRFDKLSEAIRKPHGRIYFAGDFTESSHSDGAVISAKRVVNDIMAREKGAKKIN
jgi:monoamine oxidase